MKKLYLSIITLLLSATSYSKPYCVAHRSLGFGELENSQASFLAASRANASAIEFDLLHTKDKKTIVYHDHILDRLVEGVNCPKGELVSSLTLKEIQDNCLLKNKEKISTLEDTLKLLSNYDSKLFIEFKDQSITKDDLALIKNFYSERPENIAIISFNKEILDKVIKVKTVDTFYNKIKVILLKKYGFLGSIKNFDGIDAKYITKLRVKKLQRQGKLVGVYTKDSKRKIKRYLRKGVDFITTNNHKLCHSIIESFND